MSNKKTFSNYIGGMQKCNICNEPDYIRSVQDKDKNTIGICSRCYEIAFDLTISRTFRRVAYSEMIIGGDRCYFDRYNEIMEVLNPVLIMKWQSRKESTSVWRRIKEKFCHE